MSVPLIPLALKTAFASIGTMASSLQAVLAVGSTAAGFVTQKQTADAQEAEIKRANDIAQQQAISDYDQMARAGQQEKAAATQKISDNAIAAKRAEATAKASASEAGVGGLSINSLLTDIYGQEARIRDGVNQNLENTQNQFKAETDTIGRNLKNTLMTRPAVQRPSVGGAILEAGTGIYDAYKDDLRMKSKTK